jgi:glycosyltransferase involved in cell wall biosynthesis
LAAIQAAHSRHEFIVFSHPPIVAQKPKLPHSLISRVMERMNSLAKLGATAGLLRRAPPPAPERLSFEQQSLRDTHVDVVWFLIPWARPVSVPYIATVWDLEHRKQPYFPEVSVTGWTWEMRERTYGNLLPRAARIITGTQAGKNEIVSFYRVRPENVRVVRFPVADEFRQVSDGNHIAVRARYGIANPFVFYPAQFWPHKNHVNLLLALRLLNNAAGHPLDLVLTGADVGNLGYVKQMIGELGLTAQVHVLGYVSRDEIAGLYREAEALVFPSFFGPDNLPPLEAFASGCPVALSRLEGADEQLEDAAILFDPSDPSAIAQAIQTLRTNKQLRIDLAQRGRELVALRTSQAYLEEVCLLLDEFEPLRRCWGRHYYGQH